MTHTLAERCFDLILWLAGAGHFVILFASAQVPSRLRWKQDLAQLMPFNRKLLWVQGGFTVLTIIAFGILTLALHAEMLRGDRAAMGENHGAPDGVSFGGFVSGSDGRKSAFSDAWDIWARVDEVGGAVCAVAVAARDQDAAGDGSGDWRNTALGF